LLFVGATLAVVAAGLVTLDLEGKPLWGDLAVLIDATERLFSGQNWYLDRQVGSYPLILGDVLYPPVAAWFFAPWLVLPELTFSAIPVAILAWFVYTCRPAMWAWPLIALCAVYPRTLLYIWYGNPGLWMAAFVALGFRYHWPGALILLKPSLLPFALVGIRHRSWWVMAFLLGIGSLPFLTPTFAYPAVVMGVEGGGLLYSLPGVPVMLLPVIAWFSRAGQPAGWSSWRPARRRSAGPAPSR
jgi:hypothetical protein